jgi:hypothetical protein
MSPIEKDIFLVNQMRSASGRLPTIGQSRAACLLGIAAMAWGEWSGWGLLTGIGACAFLYSAIILDHCRRIERVRGVMAWRRGS